MIKINYSIFELIVAKTRNIGLCMDLSISRYYPKKIFKEDRRKLKCIVRELIQDGKLSELKYLYSLTKFSIEPQMLYWGFSFNDNQELYNFLFLTNPDSVYKFNYFCDEDSDIDTDDDDTKYYNLTVPYRDLYQRCWYNTIELYSKYNIFDYNRCCSCYSLGYILDDLYDKVGDISTPLSTEQYKAISIIIRRTPYNVVLNSCNKEYFIYFSIAHNDLDLLKYLINYMIIDKEVVVKELGKRSGIVPQNIKDYFKI
jgi:hypothetical protein